jgi:hypothetical protein
MYEIMLLFNFQVDVVPRLRPGCTDALLSLLDINPSNNPVQTSNQSSFCPMALLLVTKLLMMESTLLPLRIKRVSINMGPGKLFLSF